MGLFSNSGKSGEFYDAFVDLWRLLANYSFKEISREIAIPKIDANYSKLLVIAKKFSNPFDETFKYYSNKTTMFGEKITIAEGIAILHIAIDAVSQGTRLTNQVQTMIFAQAKTICSTYEGKQSIRAILR